MTLVNHRTLFWGQSVVALLFFILAVGQAVAAEPKPAQTTKAGLASGRVETVVVTGRRSDLSGRARAASEGSISASDIALRPLLRPAEIVEEIPGVIVTQHSGSGKANQYFLRGFNLDHGTDLAISVDDVPINMPSHAHGQGYADLNFLIPELVERVDYKKGPYYADVGDFGSAGAFDVSYYDILPAGFVRLEGGQIGYARGVLADNAVVGTGNLLYALELEHNDGPWSKGDNERKVSGVLRYSKASDGNIWTLTAEAYHNIWNATDQIPDRAIEGEADPVSAPTPPLYDLISRWGEIDPTDGGITGRYSLSTNWRHDDGASRLRLTAYGLYYELNLFSNFTYFLNDPVHGDQIEQEDGRFIFGGEMADTLPLSLFGHLSQFTAGLDLRNDDIHNGLYHTVQRMRLSTTTLNDIVETSASPYAEDDIVWTDWLRTTVGLRGELYWMGVRNLAGGSSGDVAAQVLSPKLSVVLGPWSDSEFYIDFGQGFHSNDARGVVAAQNPATALPRSTGAEIGARTGIIPGLRSEVSLWLLDLKSELVWDGDSGDNVPSGPTRRYGVELANWYTPTPWLTVDADYAWSHARYTDHEAAGSYVPEALVATFDGGVALRKLGGWLDKWSMGLRLRYFGPRPLTQDGTVNSKATTLLYADVGYKFNRTWSLSLNIFNLLNTNASDIDYYYTSRLPGESPTGVADVHTHPSEPRECRISLTAAL